MDIGRDRRIIACSSHTYMHISHIMHNVFVELWSVCDVGMPVVFVIIPTTLGQSLRLWFWQWMCTNIWLRLELPKAVWHQRWECGTVDFDTEGKIYIDDSWKVCVLVLSPSYQFLKQFDLNVRNLKIGEQPCILTHAESDQIHCMHTTKLLTYNQKGKINPKN